MRVFIAGATGILGRRVVRLLRAAGHDVVGASRSAANRAVLADLGATAVDCDLFSAPSVLAASAGCDAVLHLATAIPPAGRTRVSDWAMNDRLRREGTANLLAAAQQLGCQVYVQESVAFLYGDRGGAWVDEDAVIPDAPPAVIRSALDMERLVRASGVPARLLRFGGFYAADSEQTRALIAWVRSRRFRTFGDVYWTPIHIDDAASAVVAAAVTPGATGVEVFNIVDDTPVTVRELVDHLAGVLGVRRCGSAPAFLARLFIGAGFDAIAASVRVRNQRAKERLGWRPSVPSALDGYAAIATGVGR